MPEKRSRFVLLCQQALAFGTVVAIVAPAAGVVTLDIVAPAPGVATTTGSPHVAGSLVASEPTAPDVNEVPIDGVDERSLKALPGPVSRQQTAGDESLAVLTAPEPVTGYSTIGVTWKHGASVDDQSITVSVRSLKDGVWSEWQKIPYDTEHGPDPDSEDAKNTRPGTDPVVVGDVSDVQVKATTISGKAPPDMQLAVIDPGETLAPKVEKPAIDTARLASAETISDGTGTPAADPTETPVPTTTDPAVPTTDATLTGTPAVVTPKPLIYSRAQWGADERMRDKSSLHYGEVHAGFVHHTVNANGYTRAQVPSIIRGIYAYHTQSKGWSDIGYNFLVDRFGRIWEGRYGGVDRPVVGAHTLGYNDYSFAMSAIGNYDIYDKGRGIPSSAMLDAYGRLFAWKLSLHGVDAASTRQWVGKKYFQAINGHRDAGQTACPGRYLYAKLPAIRTLAAKYQKSFITREKSTDISGTRWPDLVVRDQGNNHAYLVQTGGQVGFDPARQADTGWGGMDLMAAAGDLNGDRRSDMVGRNANTKVSGIYPGNGSGGFGPALRTFTRFQNLDQLTGVGDFNGDGKNDMVGRNEDTKRLYLYLGTGRGTFAGRAKTLSTDWGAYNLTAGVADFTGDGKADLMARSGNTLWLFAGTGSGLRTPVALPGAWGGYDLITGLGDVSNDGKPDIVARGRSSKLSYVFPGDGRGGLGTRFGAFSTFRSVNFLAIAGQVAGNGRADVVGRDPSGRLLVYPNGGGHNIETIVDTGTVFKSADAVLNVGDWNGDGDGDVVTRSKATGSLWLYRGDGRGHLAAPVKIGTGWSSVGLLAAVGDVTGDGYPDLMGQPDRASMRIYPGNGRTGFGASYVAHAGISANEQVGVGLWNSDGSPDSILRRSDGSLVLYPGNGPGGLTGGTVVGSGAAGYDWMLGVGDADGDGYPDIVARKKSTGTLWLLPGLDGSGTRFDKRRYIGSGFGRFDLGG